VPSVPRDIYRAYLRALYTELSVQVAPAPERDWNLTTDVLELSENLVNLLSRRQRRLGRRALIVEWLDADADVRTMDRVPEAIALALDTQRLAATELVVFSLASPDPASQSLWLNRKLLPVCNDLQVAFITIYADPNARPTVLAPGRLFDGRQEGLVPALTSQPEEVFESDGLDAETIESMLDVLFGHFALVSDGDASPSIHVSTIVGIRRAARDPTLVVDLRRRIARALGTPNFKVCGYGVPGDGIDSLSLELCDGDPGRLLSREEVRRRDRAPIALLCDVLDERYPISSDIEELRKLGATPLVVASLVHSNPPLDIPTPVISYVSVPYTIYRKDSCPFCQQQVPLVSESHDFDSISRRLMAFHEVTFWELVGGNSQFFSIGHWRSDRTPNHYYFRIMTRPLLRRHGFGLAARIRNMLLNDRKIPPTWVTKILCTEGEEAVALANNVLGLSMQDIVRIPRKYFSSIAGKEIGEELPTFIEKQYGRDSLFRQRVLVVDQAAHHFRTFSSLRNLCEYYGALVLAFAVFVDRSPSQISWGDHFYDSHYVPLYSCPCTPRRDYECLCHNSESAK
jgi:hypothetical protein